MTTGVLVPYLSFSLVTAAADILTLSNLILYRSLSKYSYNGFESKVLNVPPPQTLIMACFVRRTQMGISHFSSKYTDLNLYGFWVDVSSFSLTKTWFLILIFYHVLYGLNSYIQYNVHCTTRTCDSVHTSCVTDSTLLRRFFHFCLSLQLCSLHLKRILCRYFASGTLHGIIPPRLTHTGGYLLVIWSEGPEIYGKYP